MEHFVFLSIPPLVLDMKEGIKRQISLGEELIGVEFVERFLLKHK